MESVHVIGCDVLTVFARMGPPKTTAKRPAPSDSSTTSPTTPASAPGTPRAEEPPKKQPRKKTPEEQLPLTPLQKAKDMCGKCLKRKSDASNLGLTLQSIPYADALSSEMTAFAKKFECLGSHFLTTMHGLEMHPMHPNAIYTYIYIPDLLFIDMYMYNMNIYIYMLSLYVCIVLG